MRKIFSHPWTHRLACWLAGGVFVVAGALKLKDPMAFADSIATFQLVPAAILNLIAMGLPPLEILAGLMVITGWQRRAGTFSLMAMTAVFILALGQALVRGIEVDCGCFGSGAPAAWKTWASLGRNVLLVVLQTWIYRQELGHEKKCPLVENIDLDSVSAESSS